MECKDARVHAQILPRLSVVLIAKGIAPSPNLVTPMDVQVQKVRSSLLVRPITESKQTNKKIQGLWPVS